MAHAACLSQILGCSWDCRNLGMLDLRFRFAPDLQDICQLGNCTFLGDRLIPNMHHALQRRTSVEQGPQKGTLFCIRALQFT